MVNVLVILGAVWFVFSIVFVLALCLAAHLDGPSMGSRTSNGATDVTSLLANERIVARRGLLG